MTVPREIRDAATASTAGSARLRGIEGLRGLAAFGVLLWHVWAHATDAPGYGVPLPPFTKVFDNARVGVAMFFVLSGFLLYRPFASAVIRGRPMPSVRRYFRSRALRILPAYWTVLLAVTILFQRSLLERPVQLLANLTFVQNYVPSYVQTPFHGFGIAPAWSLCIEVVFYLLLPVVGLLSFVLADSETLTPVAATFVPVALLGVTGVGALLSSRLFRLGEVWRLSFLPHAHWFAIGMSLSIVRTLWEDGRAALARWWRPAATATALLLAASAVKLEYSGTLNFDEGQSLLTVSCGLLLALVVLPPPRSRLLTVLEWPPLFGLGLISYSVFLWHEPILRALRDADLTAGGRVGFGYDLLLLTAITLVASVVTYLLVERTALKRKTPWSFLSRDERTAELSAAP